MRRYSGITMSTSFFGLPNRRLLTKSDGIRRARRRTRRRLESDGEQMDGSDVASRGAENDFK